MEFKEIYPGKADIILIDEINLSVQKFNHQASKNIMFIKDMIENH